MGCRINTSIPPILCKISACRLAFRFKTVAVASSSPDQQESVSTSTVSNVDVFTVNFKTLGDCKLGISRYPDFEYNARGGTGTGTAIKKADKKDEFWVSFELDTLYIPPLTSATTKFLGLPLPPALKIDIVPQLFQGSIGRDSGKVDLEFTANFLFSAGSIYRAPPLLVKTVLTSDESKGIIRSGQGKRLDKEGICRLVGVATVESIDDLFMNTFLSLPTECLADLRASISFSESS